MSDYVMTDELMLSISESLKSGDIVIPEELKTVDELDSWIMTLDLNKPV